MIYLECKPDKALVSAIGIPSREISHERGKTKVCKKLEKYNNSKGLVDEDPFGTQPRYIRKLRVHSNKHSVKILEDETNNNYLIVLCPALEGWVLEAAREAKIDISEYGFPPEPNRFHKAVNTRLKNFERLLEDLIKQKSKMIITLEGFLKGKI
ncbi:MAG: hypothetical protein MUP17_00735 [candidate division Zixibacteria bacterium]|nr:hypothetical protein [candidate division Zixibacteria bacterium]